MSKLAPSYEKFIADKVKFDHGNGFDIRPEDVNPILQPHNRDMVLWAVLGGQRAIFAAFGMGKTVTQLEVVRLTLQYSKGSRGLIILPLGVRQEFFRDAELLATGQHERITDEQRAELYRWQSEGPNRIISLKFIRSTEEIDGDGIYITNYESVREGKLDPTQFDVVSLDEASCLRGFGGTKTFREFMATIAGDDRRQMGTVVQRDGVKYRYVATATPSPNEYIELLAYAAFLGIMDVGQAKTRFFKRNSEKADQLTLHEHKEHEFWLWVSSWALFVQKPSDLGYSDEGYELPPIEVRWHEVESDHSDAGSDRRGQGLIFKNTAIGVVEASREKRSSLATRIEKMTELRTEFPEDHVLLWHDLEDERRAIESAIPSAVSVYGTQDLDERERAIIDFSEGRITDLAAKPVIAGSGCNFQRHCHWAIFLGIGFKFNDFIQAVHRIQRFLQTKPVRIDIIYTEAEREVKQQLERKWEQHNVLVAKMTAIIKEFGLSKSAMANSLKRSMVGTRREVGSDRWQVVNNDSVIETANLPENSVDLILTSIPFSTQYEYSPSYNDFGHTDSNEHFWQQMGFLIPQLLRVLKPGRVAAIHVKDRIIPGGVSGFGFQTVYPFSDDCIRHFASHGFAFLGRRTIVTDVVRENAQTYRLGWSEQCKDGSRMGNGMPEYMLVFRKAPTDMSNGYADDPVVKSKEEYTRGRWQFDAHGYWRSSGNRLLQPEDFKGLTHADIFKLFKSHTLQQVYDHERIVKIAEYVDEKGMLPPSFMLLQPQSWHEDVWTDITRMRTLNAVQSAKGREMHLCPMQFDIADRVIKVFSMEGETVFDPFAGLGTVPLRAVEAGRFGLGCELSPAYFAESIFHLGQADSKRSMPTLFDLEEVA